MRAQVRRPRNFRPAAAFGVMRMAEISNKGVGVGAACAMLGVALAFATSSESTSSSSPEPQKQPIVAPAQQQHASAR
jgi:hypothetical protein